MARILTAVAVTVRPGRETEWLAAIAALATRLGIRGQHLWVFRRRGDPATFLEFTEGRDDGTHRRHGPADEAEAELEATLRQLAEYPTDHPDVWDEVPASRADRER